MKLNLPRLPRHHDFNTRMETVRIYAEKRQTATLISRVALQNWYGRWDVFICNYVPAEQRSQYAAKHRFVGEDMIFI